VPAAARVPLVLPPITPCCRLQHLLPAPAASRPPSNPAAGSSPPWLLPSLAADGLARLFHPLQELLEGDVGDEAAAVQVILAQLAEKKMKVGKQLQQSL